ncbi:MAG: cupredoxin domain-containing protein [Actinomycetota bacterium]|nr:cupredoxin domain-containing protein [Actinomycetota bacterium]
MADPEEIYSEVLTEEQGKGVSSAVAEGRAKAARSRAEAGSPHPKEPKWWPGAQPHLEGGDGAAPAEAAEAAPEAAAAEEAAAEEPAAEEPAAEAEAPAEPATEEVAAEQQPAEAPTAPEAPAATEEQQAEQVPQEQAPAPAEPVQPAAESAPQPAAQARPSGVTHGTATGTRVRPEDAVTTEAQYAGQQAVYDRRKLIDELIATGVPAAAASDAGERRSPMLFFLYLLIPLLAIGIVLSLDEGGGTAAAPAGEDGGGGGGGLTISAAQIQFDTQELTFPADEATTLTFNNEDSVEHNVAIYETEDAEQDIFVGRIIGGGTTVDYEVPATPAGEHFFRCDVHPTAMTGTAIFE